jgi:hypothetical protein
MFRITIRELLLVTVIAGMGAAWGMEHTAHVAVREDAEFLARYGDPFRGACGSMFGAWRSTANKYYDRDAEPQQVVVTKGDDGTIMLDIRP